jgi:hypothetical protein
MAYKVARRTTAARRVARFAGNCKGGVLRDVEGAFNRWSERWPYLRFLTADKLKYLWGSTTSSSTGSSA